MDNIVRSRQLLGSYDSTVSLATRPLALWDSSLGILAGYSRPVIFAGKGKLVLLPVTITQQWNSHHPYGWNDGSMIAARGWQVYASAGIYASLAPVEIQIQPEVVHAAAADYETSADYGSNAVSVTKVLPGQSSIRISAFSLSAGLSTENLWWGPGIHSSLLLSNNAPGFLHGFFKSQRPIHTPIGHFEWQLIGGKLSSGNEYPYENANLQKRNLLGSRYLSAYVISYSPKWTPGLFLGMTRGLQRYRRDIDKSGSSLLSKYIPVLTKAFQKQNAQNDDTMHTDQLASFFVRWMFPKAHFEFYAEYGYNDYGQNVRDYLMSPTHSAAYIVGIKKIVPLTKTSFIDLGVEITQMSQSPDGILRDAGNWYIHNLIKEGYTNANQIIGAGAGLGANVQSATATWVHGSKRLGILFERVERDPQYHKNVWVDYGIGILPQLLHKNILFSGKFQFINSSQYAWQKDVNRFNVHSRVSVQYVF